VRSLIDSAMVIARRDFVATVFSKTFLLFLLAPVLAIAFGGLIGGMTGEADALATQPTVAVVADAETGASPPRKLGCTTRPMCQSCATMRPPAECTACVTLRQPATCASFHNPGA